jgi:hypothetical protein
VWRRWLPLAAVVALLGAAMLASLFANPSIPALVDGGDVGAQAPQTRSPGPTIEVTEPPSATPPPPDEAVLPGWVGWLLTALCLTGIAVVVGALLWLLLRDRLVQRRSPLRRDEAQLPTIAETQQRVRAAVDEGLADLDDNDADPRRAVIACWVRLETAAAAAGTPREVGDTSTELVARLLADHMVSGEVLAGFAAVYRQARFATHAVDESMRDQARAALRQVRDELVAGVGS